MPSNNKKRPFGKMDYQNILDESQTDFKKNLKRNIQYLCCCMQRYTSENHNHIFTHFSWQNTTKVRPNSIQAYGRRELNWIFSKINKKTAYQTIFKIRINSEISTQGAIYAGTTTTSYSVYHKLLYQAYQFYSI